MNRRRTLVPDLQLKLDVELLSDGRSVHSLAETVSIYNCAADLFNKTGDVTWKALFEAREAGMREFVRKRRAERYQERLTPLPGDDRFLSDGVTGQGAD